jgi:hypothetical protein
LAGYLVKPLLSLYGTEWRELGYGLRIRCKGALKKPFKVVFEVFESPSLVYSALSNWHFLRLMLFLSTEKELMELCEVFSCGKF